MNEDPTRTPTDGARRFATTRWSLVLSAAGGVGGSGAALGELCRIYWYPVYAYVRRRGYSPADAEDLTQGFFHHLIQHQSLAGIRREGGRFRSFLLVSVGNFLTNEYDRRNSRKRGGGRKIVSLDVEAAEGRYALEVPDRDTPETSFERRWAFALLDSVSLRMGEEYAADGREGVFEAVRGYLPGAGSDAPYAEVAARLRMSEGPSRWRFTECASVTARWSAKRWPTPSRIPPKSMRNCATSRGSSAWLAGGNPGQASPVEPVRMSKECCAECGCPLPSALAGGLCPSCLLGLGAATHRRRVNRRTRRSAARPECRPGAGRPSQEHRAPGFAVNATNALSYVSRHLSNSVALPTGAVLVLTDRDSATPAVPGSIPADSVRYAVVLVKATLVSSRQTGQGPGDPDSAH